ncbi:MAG: hypothetical protein CR217_18280 [Beijerinckiaceae bacterium]|nr:MAG: hypothetical protein CR217_18280 [Beijerinckiaceae bacterium]
MAYREAREKSAGETYRRHEKLARGIRGLGAEKRKIEGNGKIGLEERRVLLAALDEEPRRPLSPFLTTGDMTVEGLTKNWPNAHAALGVFTAEGETFTAGHGMNDTVSG